MKRHASFIIPRLHIYLHNFIKDLVLFLYYIQKVD